VIDEIVELPVSGEPAEAAAQPETAAPDLVDQNTEPADNTEEKIEPKAEKTSEQREIDRLRRGIDRKTRQLAEFRAQRDLTPIEEPRNNAGNDSDTLSLTRAELEQLVTERATRIAPTVASQNAEFEHKQAVITSLAKDLGQERFDSLAADLDEAFSGLADRQGKPKPATDAIFLSDDPKGLIEYLADPDNVDEAEALAAMDALRVGRAIARLEVKLSAAKEAGKPKASNAPKPLEAVQGKGRATRTLDDLDGREYADARRKQIRQFRM